MLWHLKQKLIIQTMNIEARSFLWKPKDAFFNSRDRFVRESFSQTRRQLEPELRKFPDSVVDETINLYLRFKYAAQTIIPCGSDVPIDIGYCLANNMDDFGICIENFSLNGSALKSPLFSVPDQLLPKLKLDRLLIGTNIHAIAWRVSHRRKTAADYFRGKMPQDEIDTWLDTEAREDGILLERAAIEEAAHALYILSALRSPEIWLALLLEIKNGPRRDHDAICDINFPVEHHDNMEIERHARYWVEAFLRTYYKDSEYYRRYKLVYFS